MKKIISISLIVMMLLSAFGTIAYAAPITEPNYTVAESTLTIQPKKAEINVGANGSSQNDQFQIIEYPPNSNPEYDRFLIVRYDISKISATAEDIKTTIGLDKSSIDSYNKLISKDCDIAAYAVDNAVWNWTVTESGSRSITYADIFSANAPTDATSFRKYKKLDTISILEDAETITHPTATYGYANGVKFSFDVDEYVKEIKATNPSQQYITIGYAIENYKVSESVTIHFRGQKFTNSAGNSDEMKPHIYWNDFGRDQTNTLDNVTVENGILVEPFSPYTNEYRIAVIDNAKDVTISYEKTEAPSYISNEVLTGNLSGTKTLSIPVTSESGKTRTYTFKLLTLTESGLTLEKPTLTKAYKASFNTVDLNGKNALYLYGNTNIADSKVISEAGIELYSPIFGKADLKADANTVAYANSYKNFGFRVIPAVAKVGNTFVAVPTYKYQNATIKGEEVVIKATADDKAATISKTNTVLNNGTPVAFNNVSYSIKENAVKKMTGNINFNGELLGLFGWASTAVDTRERTQVIFQFALTDAMLNADNIKLSFGMNDNYEGAKYNTLYSYNPTFVISEVTNLNNTWNNKSVRADMLKSGETDLAKTEIATYTTEDFEISRVDATSPHMAGYTYKFGGEAFTNYIKEKILAGDKIVNLCVEITDIDKYRNEEITTGYGIWIFGSSTIPTIANYLTGRSYLEPLNSALRW